MLPSYRKSKKVRLVDQAFILQQDNDPKHELNETVASHDGRSPQSGVLKLLISSV